VAALQQDPDAIAYNRPSYTAASAPPTLAGTQAALAQEAEELGLNYTPKPVVGIELSDNYVPPRASTVTQGLNASLQGQLGATQLVQEAAKEYNTPYNKKQLVGINQHLADLQDMVDQIPVNPVDDAVESAAQSASQVTPRAVFSATNRGIGRYALPIAAIAGAGIGGAALANAQRQAQMQREAQQRQGVSANFY
jgi:hypothetical protein